MEQERGGECVSDVVLEHVTKRYGDELAVDDVSFQISAGEFISILGPSGSGKTTLLRMLAGFLEPSSGTISIAGRSMRGVAPYDRPVNLVFQNYALFPHMNVRDNVAYGPRRKRLPKSRIESLVDESLALVGLGSYGHRRPRELSGGQQQRVALARALINRPRVLLLDEPLAALDLKLRKQMQVELKNIQQQIGVTFVYVTHDQEEALVLSDRIAVMNAGRLEQLADPYVVYERPASAFVADFIGQTNLLDCTLESRTGTRLGVRTGETGFTVEVGNGAEVAHERVLLSLRPEHIRISPSAIDADNVLSGTIAQRVYLGTLASFHVQISDSLRLAITTSDQRLGRTLARGDRVYVGWSAADATVVKG